MSKNITLRLVCLLICMAGIKAYGVGVEEVCDTTALGFIGKYDTKAYILLQNSPNPFVKSTKIIYYIPERKKVILKVYNLKGEIVKTALDKEQDKGWHAVSLCSKNKLSNGVYFYQIETKDFRIAKKMVKMW
ncbi:MAG: T9SS type A sorting domain-containing protein [bacterium]|nr:T9SS type A sorting domain-containing protein [bacterium]